MGLDELAAHAGTTTHHQETRGIPTIDDTNDSLTDRLTPYEAELPCSAPAAATVVRTHVAGTPLHDSARAADLTPITAAKTLHRLGIDGVCPLVPTAREIVRDWIAGDLTRTEAIELTGATPHEFALTAYIETHDPLPDAHSLLDSLDTPTQDSMVEKRDHLAETMTDPTDLV